MRYYALFFMLFTMASVGLPGLANFVGEFLALVGVYHASSWVAVVMTTGIILGAAYMLYLYRRVCFGTSDHADAAAMPDLNAREWLALAPIAMATIWMGVYPESFMAPMRGDVTALTARLAASAPVGEAHLMTSSAASLPREGGGPVQAKMSQSGSSDAGSRFPPLRENGSAGEKK
jgi:NADH-quinone oxidoreductase subunit M